jgi:adenine-specific DNA methylase
MDEPRFEIVTGTEVEAVNPDQGTISRGVARSPWTGQTIDGDYIKAEAQAGRMGQILYAVILKVRGGFEFRAPNLEDQNAILHSEKSLINKMPGWKVNNLIPFESIPVGLKTDEPMRYGEYYWTDTFAPRQLYCLSIYKEALLELTKKVEYDLPDSDRADAIIVYLASALDKAVIYNNHHCRFDPTRGIRSVFDRHDFAFVWSFAEFDASANLLPWVVSQVEDAYRELANLITPSQLSFISSAGNRPVDHLQIIQGSATSIPPIHFDSIFNITVDPPYYDNVQYAELSDFFYVWLKRSVGHLFPEFFTDELTNKDDEAVANPARFAGMGRNKNVLARQDYERKMLAAFREMHRVLHPDGCLTVMFTHKKVEAWDTLATALIDAGFTIQASWPVHTESEHSLHQAKKNAASSTILLACRKRLTSPSERGAGGEVWWDDLQGRVRQTARQKAEQFSAQGIRGVDLYLSTFGPTLSIISENWPVLTSEVDPRTGQPKTLRPETALDLAREEVIRLRKQGLLSGRDIQFDPVTDWYLMAWDAFAAEQFPYDEARKLAIALGVDLDHDLMAIERLAVKKGEFVTLQKPAERRRRGRVDEEARNFEHWIDAAHTAMMLYAEDGAGPCEVFLRESGLRRDGTFKALIQALLNAIPRTRIQGRFLRPEAEVLENMRLAFFDDLVAPVEEEPELLSHRQMALHEVPGGYDFDEEQDEDLEE